MKFSRHYLGLAFAIALGTTLRFVNLDFKPLWLDEVITALFAMGKSYNDIPLNEVFSLTKLPEIFTFNAAVGCPQIAQNLANQSTHPPLFFCLMHSWLGNTRTDYPGLLFKLRSLPALFGVSAIAAIYFLNKIAFSSRQAGLIAAAFMAVSPFGVYISQEARHYTLPVLIITLSLIGLIQIQQDISEKKWRPIVWFSWAIVNAIGLYIHYFFILALLAQFATLALLFLKLKIKRISLYLSTFTFCLLPFALFIPWIPALLGHFSRPETSWLPQPQNIAPLYQIIAAWLLMVIALPVESQPLWVIIPAAILMIVFGTWLGWHFFQGIKQLTNTPTTLLPTATLGTFIICVVLEFLAIIYLLGKDISVAPRYNFVYYPAICALIGATFSIKKIKKEEIQKTKFYPSSFILYPLLVGVFSCIFVIYGFVFQKPYNPQKIADNMLAEPSLPLMVVVGYNDFQDVALGLSFALAIDKMKPAMCQSKKLETCPKIAFFERSPGYEPVWQKISQLATPAKFPLNLWVIAPGMKRQSYPLELPISSNGNCKIDPTGYHRIGIPYQLYRCNNNRVS
ncbi:MAG TPA: glycosyltransferase family 39 protein [Leptolyngbyaceae cyanobacterium]